MIVKFLFLAAVDDEDVDEDILNEVSVNFKNNNNQANTKNNK